MRAALATWVRFTNVNFGEVGDNSVEVGEIRFARSSTLGPNEGAHSYYPFSNPSAGRPASASQCRLSRATPFTGFALT